MKIKKFTFNSFMENSYVIWDEETNEAAVVDPGMSNADEEQEFISFIKEKTLILKYQINTHCHIDHILGVAFVKEKYNPAYLIPEKDLLLFDNVEAQGQMFGVAVNKLPKPDKFLSENENIIVGNEFIVNLFTPGHSPGEFSLYAEESNFCITGDVLFKEGIGRTDLLGGDYETLINSIRSKLFTLPDDVVIYPGHGDDSTIGYEKLHNPFLV